MLIKKVATTIIWRTIADFVEDETQSKLILPLQQKRRKKCGKCVEVVEEELYIHRLVLKHLVQTLSFNK